MNTAELKLGLFQRIDSLKDDQLEEAYQYLLFLLKRTEVNPDLKSGIERAINDVKEGRVSSHEDVMKRMRKKYPNLIK